MFLPSQDKSHKRKLAHSWPDNEHSCVHTMMRGPPLMCLHAVHQPCRARKSRFPVVHSRKMSSLTSSHESNCYASKKGGETPKHAPCTGINKSTPQGGPTRQLLAFRVKHAHMLRTHLQQFKPLRPEVLGHQVGAAFVRGCKHGY